MNAATPIAEPTRARRKAREIIDANPGASLTELVALAYLEGRVEGVREVRQIGRDVFGPRPGLHEYDVFCTRCGRRAGSRFLVAKDAPPEGFIQELCFHCSSTDEPPRAA